MKFKYSLLMYCGVMYIKKLKNLFDVGVIIFIQDDFVVCVNMNVLDIFGVIRNDKR